MTGQAIAFAESTSPGKLPKADFMDLLGIASDAVRITPPLYISSIFGLPWTWLPPHRRFSEFGILDPWRLRRFAKFLVNVTVPSLPLNPPPFGPPILDDLFWEPTLILQRPDHNGSYTTFPDEAWFFINGIMTNDAVAQINAAFISSLFHRPVTLVQNSTNSFVVDMLQCALGKEWDRTVEPAIKAFGPIYDALKSPEKKRVVVIAHSQGTLILAKTLALLNAVTAPAEAAAAPVSFEVAAPAPPEFVYPDESSIRLSDFEPLAEAELARLELYSFANCANRMKYFRPARNGQDPVPWIESFGNENDIVARLGMLAPRQDRWEIELDGPCFVRERAWGHLLNEHYLFPIEDRQKSGRRKGGAGGSAPFKLANPQDFDENEVPRLYRYINGGR